jgi:predicted transglutaminase-like cysteine proteinase
MNSLIKIFGTAALVLVMSAANSIAQVKTSSIQNDIFLKNYGLTKPPYGYVAFCLRNVFECGFGYVEDAPERMIISDSDYNFIRKVNLDVNKEIEPKNDIENYEMEEWWDYPEKYGDCEDYALLKRRRLIEAGFSANHLLLSVVKNGEEGHAILIITTNRGNLILDNLTDEILRLEDTSYLYHSRQSGNKEQAWVKMKDYEVLLD